MIDILAQEAQGGGGALSFLIFLVPIGLLFFMMRNQRKRVSEQQQLQQAVDVGDEVLTSSGMFGTVVDVDDDDDTIWVEIAPGTRVHMVRGGVARRIVDDETFADEDEEQDADQP
ncbi:MAG TPA: preprotein translocase subunit YajC [Actinomycetota bacterium]|nr:preprotein translocase subunit YajC [Actinomycetota bacterium]